RLALRPLLPLPLLVVPRLSHPPFLTLFPYTTLFRSNHNGWLTIGILIALAILYCYPKSPGENLATAIMVFILGFVALFVYIYTIDRKSTRLNSSHVSISYAVFCLKKKTYQNTYAKQQ